MDLNDDTGNSTSGHYECRADFQLSGDPMGGHLCGVIDRNVTAVIGKLDILTSFNITDHCMNCLAVISHPHLSLILEREEYERVIKSLRGTNQFPNDVPANVSVDESTPLTTSRICRDNEPICQDDKVNEYHRLIDDILCTASPGCNHQVRFLRLRCPISKLTRGMRSSSTAHGSKLDDWSLNNEFTGFDLYGAMKSSISLPRDSYSGIENN